MKVSAGNRVLMLLENNTYRKDSRVRREACSLVEAGYQVMVICPLDPGRPWIEVVQGVYVYSFPFPSDGSGLLSYLWEYGYSMLATFIISLFIFFYKGFDIVHAHNPPDTFVFIAAFYKLLGKRFVYDHHDLSPEMYYARFGGTGNRLIYNALVLFEQLSCRYADHVIATNQSYKTIQMERGCVPEERITIVRNGPDLARVQLVDPDPDLRQKGKTIIGYVGVMGFQDGVDYLLRALKHLVSDLERTDFFCVLIGRGDAWEDLKRLSTQLGLDEYIWFTGHIPDADLMRYLSTADICVDPDPLNPFTNRSTMIKIMEFMALGKPIVAFDLTEHRFSAQDAAIYAQPNDELDFARKIALLMDDPQLCHRMGQQGRARVETELAWPYQEKRLLEAYRLLSLSSSQRIQKPSLGED